MINSTHNLDDLLNNYNLNNNEVEALKNKNSELIKEGVLSARKRINPYARLFNFSLFNLILLIIWIVGNVLRSFLTPEINVFYNNIFLYTFLIIFLVGYGYFVIKGVINKKTTHSLYFIILILSAFTFIYAYINCLTWSLTPIFYDYLAKDFIVEGTSFIEFKNFAYLIDVKYYSFLVDSNESIIKIGTSYFVHYEYILSLILILYSFIKYFKIKKEVLLEKDLDMKVYRKELLKTYDLSKNEYLRYLNEDFSRIEKEVVGKRRRNDSYKYIKYLSIFLIASVLFEIIINFCGYSSYYTQLILRYMFLNYIPIFIGFLVFFIIGIKNRHKISKIYYLLLGFSFLALTIGYIDMFMFNSSYISLNTEASLIIMKTEEFTLSTRIFTFGLGDFKLFAATNAFIPIYPYGYEIKVYVEYLFIILVSLSMLISYKNYNKNKKLEAPLIYKE